LLEQHAAAFFEIGRFVEIIDDRLKLLAHRDGEHAALPDEDRRRLKESVTLVIAKKWAEGLGLDSVVRQLANIDDGLSANSSIVAAQVLFNQLQQRISAELPLRRFLYLAPDDAASYQKPLANWEAVVSRFPSVQFDISEAECCLATGHPTAAVFHLMRVAEIGLRALARVTRVPMLKTVDQENWGRLIPAIDTAINKMPEGRKTTKKRRDTKQFLSDVAANVGPMRYAWRDDVMHSHTQHSDPAARAILFAVRSTMTKLAERVDQNGKWVQTKSLPPPAKALIPSLLKSVSEESESVLRRVEDGPPYWLRYRLRLLMRPPISQMLPNNAA